MRRKTFDKIVTLVGAGLTVLLFIVGGLALWGYNFTNSNVHNQLAEQDIFFPAKSAFVNPPMMGEVTKGMVPYLAKYAGQQLLTGSQAEAYADHFIAVHLQEMAGGKTYSQVSAEFLAMKPTDPNYQTVANLRNTMFQGTTLRGLLLEAYAFGTMGQIALIGAIVSFVGGAVMLLLTILGWLHIRRTDDEATL